MTDDNRYALGLAIGLAVGLGFGISLGVALGNLGLWIPVGLGLGVGIGFAYSEALRQRRLPAVVARRDREPALASPMRAD